MSWTHQFWTDLKKNLDFVYFPFSLSIFGVAAWFPFDKGQPNSQTCDFLHEMFVILFPEWAPESQTHGYHEICENIHEMFMVLSLGCAPES